MTQLIDKSALVAEIERKADIICQGVFSKEATMSVEYFKDSLISFLDTLEVKSVDFERELGKYVSKGIHRFFPGVEDDYCTMDSIVWQHYVIDTAVYFFELGLKVQKGGEK